MKPSAEPPQNPAGAFTPEDDYDDDRNVAFVDTIAQAPALLREAVSGLDPSQLDTPYRNWSIRQIVHHLADSHVHSYIRFKWALTEDTPTIKAYFEARWAELPDYAQPIATSLDFLDALHARWVVLLRSLRKEDFQREFHHPESDSRVTLRVNVGIYAWHGRHHLAHVTRLLERLES